MEHLDQKLSALEALLFLHGEPLPRTKAEKILEVTKEEMDLLLQEFAHRLQAEERGLALLRDEVKLQLTTKPEFGKILERFVKEELREDLTPASIEALSLIAYLGPVPRNRVDYIRGVNSSFILRSLMLRGLVERTPDPERSFSYLYRPTFELLRHLGVKNQEELPEYEKFRTLLKNVAAGVEENISQDTAAPLGGER